LTMACSIPTAASAGRRARYNQSETPTTILPTRQEVAAVPIPERGRVLAYPVDVFRYGRTIHPGSRAVRRLLGR
jgi:hypothetical protein